MPYLNRAIAEEQLGVNAASAGKATEAAEHYQAAIQVCSVFIGSVMHFRLCLMLSPTQHAWMLKPTRQAASMPNTWRKSPWHPFAVPVSGVPTWRSTLMSALLPLQCPPLLDWKACDAWMNEYSCRIAEMLKTGTARSLRHSSMRGMFRCTDTDWHTRYYTHTDWRIHYYTHTDWRMLAPKCHANN